MALYNYKRKELPDAGAQQYAFYPQLMDPVYTLPGPGTPYGFQWRVTQPEQVYYNQAQVQDGILGVVAGQAALTGLLDLSSVNGANG
jgi:hypothetical protein